MAILEKLVSIDMDLLPDDLYIDTLEIPSALNPTESNYLINVKHPLMEKIKNKGVTSFRIDNRLSEY